MEQSTVVRWGNMTHTDEHGVTREYDLVYRHAVVGDLIQVVGGSGTLRGVHKVTASDSVGVTCPTIHFWLWHCNYAVLEPTDIVVHNGKRYRTVKRRALNGELVQITSNRMYHYMDVGSVHVAKVDPKDVMANGYFLEEADGSDRDYVVLEPADTPLSLDDIVRDLQRVCADYRALSGRVDTLERKSVVSTSVTVNIPPTTSAREVATQVSTEIKRKLGVPYTRDEIIELAKADVRTLVETVGGHGWGHTDIPKFAKCGPLTIKFRVDRKSRTVYADGDLKHIPSGRPYFTGFAQCAPDDCFNVHIGRAIALRKALGLDVPSYYTHAPQPTGFHTGDKVRLNSSNSVYTIGKRTPENDGRFDAGHAWQLVDYPGGAGWLGERQGVVIDDSHDFGGERS